MHRKRELDSIQQKYEETDGVAEETDRHCEEIEVALKQFDDRPLAYDATDIAYAGYGSIAATFVQRTDRLSRRFRQQRFHNKVVLITAQNVASDCKPAGTNGASSALSPSAVPPQRRPDDGLACLVAKAMV
jgi:hypothetical protein